jgi:hypothetical protein
MKPKNFPERKRQRQLKALARLLNPPTSKYNNDRVGYSSEVEVLHKRTIANLRDVRTKKQRGGKRG